MYCISLSINFNETDMCACVPSLTKQAPLQAYRSLWWCQHYIIMCKYWEYYCLYTYLRGALMSPPQEKQYLKCQSLGTEQLAHITAIWDTSGYAHTRTNINAISRGSPCYRKATILCAWQIYANLSKLALLMNLCNFYLCVLASYAL